MRMLALSSSETNITTLGTGTAVGDPLEASAIGNVFGPHRSESDPIYMYVSSRSLLQASGEY
jgi:3-oxoacyl-(acyl-carrier-protein) synthase